ncbi:MAG: hypothetical protein M1608_16590 [Candidatus Omnitrophica bacterium]|nr:hypothetical protein [Candidatus Omnitrophota bacterium]
MEKPISPPPVSELSKDYQSLAEWLRSIPNYVPRVTNYSVSLDIASVAANSVSRQSFTVDGIDAADSIFVNSPSLDAGLEMLAGYRVTAANTVEIPFWNSTGGAINPGAATFKIWAFR